MLVFSLDGVELQCNLNLKLNKKLKSTIVDINITQRRLFCLPRIKQSESLPSGFDRAA